MLDVLKAMNLLRSPDVVVNLESFHVQLAKFMIYLENFLERHGAEELEIEEFNFLESGRGYLDFLKSFGIDLVNVVKLREESESDD